jgi:hypothetical protein
MIIILWPLNHRFYQSSKFTFQRPECVAAGCILPQSRIDQWLNICHRDQGVLDSHARIDATQIDQLAGTLPNQLACQTNRQARPTQT